MFGSIYFGQMYPAGAPFTPAATPTVHYLAPPERKKAVPSEKRVLKVPAEEVAG